MALRVGFAHPLPQVAPETGFLNSVLLMNRQVFDAPFFPSTEGQSAPRGVLFEQFESTSSDATQFRATIRADVRFSDGSPLTAAEMAECFERSFVHPSKILVRGNQLTFQLGEPNPRFDLLLSSTPLIFKVVSQKPIGTGKYRVRSWHAAETVLEPNPFHSQPPTEEVVFQRFLPGTGAGSLVAALNAGEVDLAPSLSWTDLEGLTKVSKITKPVNATGMLYLNTQRLAEVSLRAALASALNSSDIARAAFQSNGTLEANSFLPTDFGAPFARFPKPSPATWALDRAPLKMKTVFTGRSYLPFPKEAALAVVAQLKRAQIAVELDVLTTLEDYQQCISSGDYDLLLAGNIAENEDPVDFLFSLFNSAAIPGPGKLAGACNFSRLNSSTVDAQLSHYRATRSDASLSALQAMLRDCVPAIPLTHGRAVMAHQWTLKNVLPTMASIVDLSLIQFRHRLT